MPVDGHGHFAVIEMADRQAAPGVLVGVDVRELGPLPAPRRSLRHDLAAVDKLSEDSAVETGGGRAEAPFR